MRELQIKPVPSARVNLLILVVAAVLLVLTLGWASSIGGRTVEGAQAIVGMLLGLALPFGALAASFRTWPNDAALHWLRNTPWRPGRPLPGGTPGFSGWAFVWLAWAGLAAAATAWLDGFDWPWIALTGLLATGAWATLILAAYGLFAAPAGEDRPRREVRKLHWALLLAGLWLMARRNDYNLDFQATAHLAAALVAGMVACSVAGYWRAWRCLPRRVLEPPASGVVGFGGGVRQRRVLAENGTLWPAPVAADPRPAWWITLAGGGLMALLAGLAAVLAAGFLQAKFAVPEAGHTLGRVLTVCGAILAGGVLLLRVNWNMLGPHRRNFPPPGWFGGLRWAVGTVRSPRWLPFWIGSVAAGLALAAGDAAGLRAPEVAGLTLAAAVFCAATLPPSRRWCELCGDGVIRRGVANLDDL